MIVLWFVCLAAVASCLEANPQLKVQWGQSSKQSSSYLLQHRPQGSHRDHDYSSYDSERDEYGDYTGDYVGQGDYGGPPNSPTRRCSCILYIRSTQLFRRTQSSSWFTCNQSGLDRCSRYCRDLFRDSSVRASSRRDACAVLGRRVNSPWFRKDQVCGGTNGLFRDYPMPTDLCCSRGRPCV